eukprot:m.71529 g.71529  ORF g.71529 m.71529 type:complete len:57 (+) comp11707_c0_seq16:1682-1852(+)
MSKIVPDGIVCFFVSYEYLESMVTAWFDQGIIDEIRKRKLGVFLRVFLCVCMCLSF